MSGRGLDPIGDGMMNIMSGHPLHDRPFGHAEESDIGSGIS